MHQKVEMVRHQAVRQYVAIVNEVFPDFLQEILIVFLIIKEALSIITTVIHMVNISLVEFHTGEVLGQEKY